MKKFRVAIFGATGAVGEIAIKLLEQRKFPVSELYLLASEKSQGKKIEFCQQTYTVQDIKDFDFAKADIAIFSAGTEASLQYAPIAAKAGCVVIDNTTAFRYDDAVPLVIPEVNPNAIAQFRNKNIIANPNCSTVQLLVAIKPIYDAVGITRMNIATYQSVSGAGKEGLMELTEQTAQVLAGYEPQTHVFPCPIAFNLIPHIDEFQDNAYTKEEMKIVWETHKILQDDSILINPTAVRVPVFYGHSEAVHLETKQKLTAAEVKTLLRKSEGVEVLDDCKPAGYPTPLLQGQGSDAVYVGRIREDISHPLGLNLWIVSDNTRKGAALNAVQIAEKLIAFL